MNLTGKTALVTGSTSGIGLGIALKLAEAACGESVLQLRARLEDDAPCPVCGATAHPYREQDPRLDRERARERQVADVGAMHGHAVRPEPGPGQPRRFRSTGSPRSRTGRACPCPRGRGSG